MSSQDSPQVYVPSEIYAPETEQVVCVAPARPRYWLHVLLLAATLFTTLVVGARIQLNFMRGLPPLSLEDGIFPMMQVLRSGQIWLGVPFSLTLMLILFAHEMGHYLYCVRYGVRATLPFFIPFPTLIGTLGAFIRIRSPLRSRSVLFDVAIAGPIAGFVVAFCTLVLSLGLSHPATAGSAIPDIQLGYPLVFHLVRKLLVLTGHAGSIRSIPLSRVYLHPVAIAAWVGMFATSLNLLPGGQLDGGHIIYSISPRAHKKISRGTILVLIPLALFFWTGWLIWAVLLRLSGMRHPAVMEWQDIGNTRRWLAAFAVTMLVLTFSYAPVGPQSVIDSVRELIGTIRR
jgi:membrane-associated protease RseP (regulator of RpoE activity)